MMVREVFELVVRMSLQATLMAIAVSFIEGLFKDKIKPKYISFLWIMVFVRLIFPFEIVSQFSIFNVFSKSPALYDSGFAERVFSKIPYVSGGTATGEALSEVTLYTAAGSSSAFDISYLWLFGVVILLFVLFHYYYNLKIKLYKNQSHSLEQRLTGVFEEMAFKTGISADTEIICSEYANAPFVFGLFNPVIVLPAKILRDASKAELEIIILHEAQHIKKNHYRIKFFAVFIHIIHFFNPFLFYFTKKLGDALELECDFSLTDEVFLVDKMAYAEVLASTARNFKGSFITGLSFGQNNLKRRIELLLTDKRFTAGFSAIAMVLIIALGAGFFTVAAENKRLRDQVIENTETTVEEGQKALSESTPQGQTFGAEIYAKGAEDEEFKMSMFLKNKLFDEFLSGEIVTPEAGDSDISENVGGQLNSGAFWVNAYQKEMTYEELRAELPLKREKFIASKKIKDFNIRIEGCYLFIEYTDEDFLRAELYEKEDYKTKITFDAPWSGGKGTFYAKFPRGTDGSLYQNEPRILTVFIPKKLNAFDKTTVDAAMSYTNIYGINSEKLSIQTAMGSDIIADNHIKLLDVQGAMGNINIDFDELESLKMDNAMGNVTIDCGGILKKASLANSMGNLTINFKEEPDNLSIKGTGGMQSATVPQEWSKSSDGFSYVYGEGKVPFNIENSMGSISIE